MKRLLLSLIAIVCLAPYSHAEEGMWPLPLIEENMRDMKSKGLELLQRNINAVRKNSNNAGNAVVQLGNGATGAVISPEGLMITSGSSVYNYINSVSIAGNDLSDTGFWSKVKEDEIPVPGLTVTFVRWMGNITAEILKGVDNGLNDSDREYIIEKNKDIILTYYRKQYAGPNYRFSIVNYFEGESYVITITEVFQDIRLVGVPLADISKVGKEPAGIQWPGYAGDFALFRIYTAADGSPAAYNKTNVPYQTKSFLSVAGDTYKEGDFAMVLGFPVSTQRYMSGSELDFFIQTRVKPLVEVRGSLLGIMAKEMAQNKDLQFRYGPQYNTQLSTYLRCKAMAEGVDKDGISAAAKARDDKFREWLNNGPARKRQYGDVLQVIGNYNKLHLESSKAREYIYEAFIKGIDLLNIVQRANSFRAANTLTVRSKATLAGIVQGFYKNYDASLDRALAYEAVKMVVEKVPAELLPAEFKYDLEVNYKGNIKSYVDYLYTRSSFVSPDAFMSSWENGTPARWAEDPAMKLFSSIHKAYQALDIPNVNSKDNGAAFKAYQTAYAGYTRGLRDLGIITYPNAARNLRLTYGVVEGYSVPGGGKVGCCTTLDAMMASQKSGLPAKFTELYTAKAHQDYSIDNTLKVNFLTDTDVTTGNAGSPVLNSKGDMTGLVMGNNPEGLISEVLYDGQTNRTVSVDMHYILYIIDKYAGAGNIVDEIKIIDYSQNAGPTPVE